MRENGSSPQPGSDAPLLGLMSKNAFERAISFHRRGESINEHPVVADVISGKGKCESNKNLDIHVFLVLVVRRPADLPLVSSAPRTVSILSTSN